MITTAINSRALKQARVLASKPSSYDLSPKQIIMARHMANAGVELTEIMEALGWTCDRYSAVKQLLKRYRIRARTLQKKAHMGDRTYVNCSEKYLGRQYVAQTNRSE